MPCKYSFQCKISKNQTFWMIRTNFSTQKVFLAEQILLIAYTRQTSNSQKTMGN